MKDIEQYLISPHMSFKQTLKAMDRVKANTMFAVEKNKLVGAISLGDVRRYLLKGVKMSTPLSKIMTRQPMFVNEPYDVKAVRSIFLKKGISAIPVLNKNERIVDIVFRKDVLEPREQMQKQIKAPVVIMAGGQGTRLDPFTRILPKALIPIDEKPIIEMIMDIFKKYGMKDFIISLNDKSRMLKAYFHERTDDSKVTFVSEDKPLGTAGGLKFLSSKLKQPFFVSNCDILIDANYPEVYAFHRKGGFSLTLVASMQHHVVPYGICDLKKNGDLKRINEKPEYDFLVSTGLYVLDPDVIRYIPRNKFFHMIDLIEVLNKKGHRVGVFPVSEKSWFDIGEWEKYRESTGRLNLLVSDGKVIG